MDRIEITPELLADLKEKAEKATPGPWCTCLTAEKVLGRKHPDWGCIYANVQSSKTGEMLEGCHLLRVNSNLMTEEEATNAREKFFNEGIQTNPGIMGANAEYIAASSPDVVLALIAEIEDLRSRQTAQGVACCECHEVEAELRQEIENLRQERQILRDNLKKAVKEND